MELISYTLTDFEYRTPVSFVTEDGELDVEFVGKPILIEKITFLYFVERNKQGRISCVEGVDDANAYLMHLAVNKKLECTSVQSRALTHYFDFLSANGLTWDEMPYRQNKRPTYRFKVYLESMCHSTDPAFKLAGSTCSGYIRSIVNFYRYKLARDHYFENPPFEHEIVRINLAAGASSVQALTSMNVQTTDLRIRAAKKTTKNGVPSELIALSDFEWDELDHVIRRDRRVIKVVDGRRIVGSLPIEFTFLFLLMRFAGLRREEANTFKLPLIFKPTQEQLQHGYIAFRIGLFCGVETKNEKPREIEIPTFLMQKLHGYVSSSRYIQRRNKFEKEHGNKNTPVFLSNKGKAFSLKTLNARWCEVRNMMSHRLGRPFTHKLHNLRPTYAVIRLYALLDAGVSQGEALTFLQMKMGHSSVETTLHYLKQVKDDSSGHEKAEHVYDYLFNLEEFEI